MKPTDGVTAEIVVRHVRGLIERGELRPGDRLPPERELAVQLGVSRPSVRAGLRSLSAIGILQTRHGAGTFITDGPPTLGAEPLSFLAALHGFTRDEMFEARRALEVGVAGLAAERAKDRKSTRLNSSHMSISYAVFCLKKKKKKDHDTELLYKTAI